MPRPLSQLSPLLQLGIAALGASLVALFLRLRRPRLTANVAANPVPSKPADVVAPGAATAAPGDDTASGTELALVGGFDIGARVRLTGLASKPELNNARGCVVGHDNVKDRVNVSLENGRTLQVKPTNLTTAGAIEQLSAVELSSLALADQNAFTKEHAEHLIHLLGQPSQNPIEAGMLLRCCCSVDWHLFALRNARTKKDKMFTFDTPKGEESQGGTTIVCASSPDQLDQLRTLNPPPSGSSHTVLVVRGTELFNTKRLEGVAMISLNPFLSDSAENSRFTALPAAYFAPLQHMSEAMAVERSLPTLSAMCAGPRSAPSEEGTPPSTAAERSAAATQFARHTFFCFNAASDAESSGGIIPVTSTSVVDGKPTSWMLLYTCEMLLEHARPHLEALGAFQGHSHRISATAVPASAVLACLSSSSANSGVHVNEFVPNLAPAYKALHLPTSGFGQVAELAGAGVTV